MAEPSPFDDLRHELATAEAGFRRITNPDTREFALVPLCLPPSDANVSGWERHSIAMHERQDAIALPSKPDDGPVRRGPRNPASPPPHRLEAVSEPSRAVPDALGVELKRG